jgi:CHASE2 domain-containing sensor protein
MDALATIHSLVRWLILAVGILSLLRGLRGWLTDQPFGSPDNALGAAFTGLIDLNVLIGAVLLIAGWSDPDRPSLLHPAFMIAAAAAAHVGRVLARRGPDRGRHRWQSLTVLLSLILILIGITFT